MEHPEEAADILIKNAPELKEKRDFVIESQKYLSKEYASDKENGVNLMQLAGMPSINGIKKMVSLKKTWQTKASPMNLWNNDRN